MSNERRIRVGSIEQSDIEVPSDPRCRPFAAERADAANRRRVPRLKAMRWTLGVTQEDFSVRFQIPLDTLRDWEQGNCEPDPAAQAYLTVIARDPEAVRRALASSSRC
jgi:putative transcriptional regulator